MTPADRLQTVLPSEDQWCEDCLEDQGTSCDSCGTLYDVEEHDMYRIEDENKWVCQECFSDEQYFGCVGCNRYFTVDEGDGEMCQECLDESLNTARREAATSATEEPIQRYHKHTRNWNRFGTAPNGIYYGVELEAVLADGNEGFEEIAEHVLGKFGTLNGKEFLFTEYDGSLVDGDDNFIGYETIFHPMSIQFAHRNQNLLKRILSLMSDAGMIGYEAPTKRDVSAGMHVTITLDVMTHKERSKFLHLIYDNKALTTLVSRRRLVDLESYAEVKAPASIEAMVRARAGYDAKHVAVNLKLYHDDQRNIDLDLAEVRIFRSTLKIESFLMNLEYVAACVAFAREPRYSLSDTRAEQLLLFVKSKKRLYPNIYAWLKEKGQIA